MELTRRLRVLLHTLPLDSLRRSDTLRDRELRHYDSLALALRVLDVVIDRMGFDEEANRQVVARVLEPVLAAMDAAAGQPVSSEQHARILDKVVAGLRNDGNARRPFREEYATPGDGGLAERRFVEFRLLFDAFHPSGGTVLRPSSEACNLYLRLLDLDIEDAQAAAEAVVESQLARGRFEEAVHSARQARIQSVRFQQKVLQILRDTRRDVDRVDWHEEVPRVLSEATEHLSRRLRVERGILATADERLDAISEDNEADRQAVARVAEQVRECTLRHAGLHQQLMEARNVFLDAQARQSFVAAPRLPLPDLHDDVLDSVLTMASGTVEWLTSQALPLLTGPSPPPVLSLADLVPWMLQPRRPMPRREIPVEPVDAASLHAELACYPESVRNQATAVLSEIADPTPLSSLLARARDQGAGESVTELLALLALRGFATEDRMSAGLASEPIVDAELDDPALFGDELLLSRWNGDDGLQR